MLKGLAILSIAALLLGGPCVAENQQSQPHAVNDNTAQAHGVTPPTQVVIEPAPATPCTQEKPCYIQENAPEKPLPRWKRPEWVIVYITAIYVFIAGLTLLAIKRQADTMQQQAIDARDTGKHTETLAAQAVRQSDLTQRQLQLTHRPWIAIEEVSPASGLVFDQRGGVLMLNIRARNVGHSIAEHVINFVDYAVLGVSQMPDVIAKVTATLKQPVDPKLDHGKLLFPGQADTSQIPIIILPKYIDKALKSGPFKEQKGISFDLLVCFDYQSAIDPGVHHQTRCTFGIARIPDGGGALNGIFCPAVTIYLPQQIAIFYRGAGAYAD